MKLNALFTTCILLALPTPLVHSQNADHVTDVTALDHEPAAMTIAVDTSMQPMATGKYTDSWESLSQYDVPEWFRDAKFGMWAHWGPQCVEESGDWMARGMYMEDSNEYKWHVERYGHPSEFGFKDILPLFKAEKWNPDSIVATYKRLGARYFMALGNHHDNFDLWDSKYQQWNSMNIGPHRDILGEWEAACRRESLPFGVSLHADHAWTFYETSQRYDRKGEKMGALYDGNLTAADGKGKWWEGLDPQRLYRQDHPLSDRSWCDWFPDGQWEWGNGAALPSQEFVTEFYNRTLDVIERYDPDIIYFDATAVPFYPVSDAGLKIAAHYYNRNLARHGEDGFTAVMTGKILSPQQRKAITWDVERGAPPMIIDEPWQTCTCLGGWHYNRKYYDKKKYKSAATVVRMLADVVSKNGNLLLSVPLRADGTYDELEAAIIEDIGRWLTINGEAIYDTRPWEIFGEGPAADNAAEMRAQGFNEGQYREPSEAEIRFTTTPGALYAICYKWPVKNTIHIKSLGADAPHAPEAITEVTLLGHNKPLKTTRTTQGLAVELPDDIEKTEVPVLRIPL